MANDAEDWPIWQETPRFAENDGANGGASGSMRNLLSALAAGPGSEFWPVRRLHQSVANDVWLVRRPDGQPAVVRLSRSAAASLDLQREAAYLRQMLHPALPQVLAAFPTPLGFCLITTAFDGLNLATVLQRSGRPLPPGLVLGWAEDACAVLDYLHNGPLPLVHRDPHPGHLVVQIAPAGGRVGSLGLIDFGAAMRLGDGAGISGTADTDRSLGSLGTARLGNLEYAAPEQLLAIPAIPDPRTDVYGLAAALYRLLTGHGPARPFEFAPATAVNPAVPATISAVLQRALSPDPSARFESALAFGEAIASLRTSMHPFAAPVRSGLAAIVTEVELSAEERAALQDPAPGALDNVLPEAPVPQHPEPESPADDPAPESPAKAAAARILADVATTRPSRQQATVSSSFEPPVPAVAASAAVATSAASADTSADVTPLPSRRSRPRRRAIGLAWLLLPVLTVAGVWAVLHFSGIM